MPRLVLALAVASLTMALGLGPGSVLAADDQYGPAEGIKRAQRFDPFHVYFAGEEAAGLPLEAVLGGRNVRKTDWSFIYGDCEPPTGDGGCGVPLEVQTWSTCRRYRDLYPGEQSSFPFRGAQASRDGGGALEIYTGRVTIVIFGEHQLVAAAAEAVRKVGDESPHGLAKPAKGSLKGRLPCQPPPSENPPFFGLDR